MELPPGYHAPQYGPHRTFTKLQEQAAAVFEKEGVKPVESVDPVELYEQIGRLKVELEFVKKKAAQFSG